MILDLVDVLNRTGDIVREVDVPDVHRGQVLAAVNRLRVDLDTFADRLTPRAGRDGGGVNGTPVPLPPTHPAPAPQPQPEGE